MSILKNMPMKLSLSGLSQQQFLEQYWHKKPLLIRNAFSDFELPLSPDELAGMACEEMVESRIVLHQPEQDTWQLKQGPFEESIFAELPEKNWSLLVQAVDHWVPEAAELLEQFNFIPRWRIDDLMVSYSVVGGGVGPHYDNYDVFLIQGSGSRRWEFGGIYGEDSPRKPNMPVMILPEWKAEQSVVLQPGDMLYLPPGVGHSGVSLEDGSTTWSIGFRAPSVNEILHGFTDFIGEQLKSEQRYADADLTLQTNSGQITDEALDRVQKIILDQVNDREKLAQWFGEFVTEPKYSEITAESDDQSCGSGEVVRRNEQVRIAYTENTATLNLFINGELKIIQADSQSANFVKNLASQIELTLPQSIDSDLQQLVDQLLKSGLIYRI